jgi:hypothetical protein
MRASFTDNLQAQRIPVDRSEAAVRTDVAASAHAGKLLA